MDSSYIEQVLCPILRNNGYNIDMIDKCIQRLNFSIYQVEDDSYPDLHLYPSSQSSNLKGPKNVRFF